MRELLIAGLQNTSISVLITTALIIFANVNLTAQNGIIRGFVTDSTNGELVIYANCIITGTVLGSSTNNKGYYFIPSIPAGKHSLIISHLNYKKKKIEVTVEPNKITEVNVQLSPVNVELREVSVVGEKSVKETETDLGLERISLREIEMIPSGAEMDLFRALQTSTGVTSVGDISAQYYVRGGSGDQNLVMLNNAVVYNPYHALGILSVIDPEMVSSLEFYKGGFAPQYGGRLSSVLNIITKDGNSKRFAASGTASLLAGKAALEGPIPDGSFIVTGRKSYYSGILKKYLNDKSAPFDFYDLSFKVNYLNPKFNKDSKFVLFGFTSNDAVNNDDPLKEDYTVNNNILGLNWRQVWAIPLFSVISISYSGFYAKVNPNLSNSKPRMNRLNDVTVDFNFTYIYDNKDEMAFGIQNKIINTQLNQQNLYSQNLSFHQSGLDLTLYGNYTFYHWERLGLQLGMRAKLSALSRGRPFIFEPRFNMHYKFNEALSLKASLGRYSQELIALSDENDVLSIFQPWIIVPDNVYSPESSEISTGVNYYLSESLNLNFEVYYKFIEHMIDINEEKYTSNANDFVNLNGRAYGLELTLKYQSEQTFIKGSCSLSRTYEIKNGSEFSPKYDIRNSFNILIGYNLGKGWKISATWFLRSGMPFTPIIGFYDRVSINDPSSGGLFEPFQPTTYYAERNSKRLPYYHRLDLSISKYFTFYFAKVTIDAGVLNLYNRKNIFYFNRDTGNKIYMLPFFPSVSIKVEL